MGRDNHLPELEPVQPGSTARLPAVVLPSDSVEGELLDLKQAALQYAARGIPVFPLHNPIADGCSCGRACDSNGKHPRTKNGFKDATTDKDVIEGWWSKWPDANIGALTGKEVGRVVLDVDFRHAGEDSIVQLVKRHGPLPETQTIRTGNGLHFEFEYPRDRKEIGSCSKLGGLPGLDLRADRAYVVVPPSIHPTGSAYAVARDVPAAPMPKWLLSLHDAEEDPGNHEPREKLDTGTILAGVPKGQRDDALFRLACKLRYAGVPQDWAEQLVWDAAKNCDPPFSTDEARKKVCRAYDQYPTGPGNDLLSLNSFFSYPTGWPEPLSEEAFYGLTGEFVRIIEPHTESDPVALLIQLLVALGNVVGRGPHFFAEADKHTANLFLTIVGETAKGRKGTSWGYVKNVISMIDAQWVEKKVFNGLSSGEGLIQAATSGDTEGTQGNRLLVIESELVSTLQVLGREGNTLSAILRQAWDGGDLRVMTKNSPLHASDAHISIIGHITKDELTRRLTRTDIANGFANRFLWACAKRARVLPEGGNLNPDELAPTITGLREAITFAKTVGEVRRDDSARALWCEVYEALSDGKPGLLGAVISRAEAQVMRLALIYALLDQSSDIRVEHLQAALALWQYCEDSAAYIFGDAVGDPVAEGIWSALMDHSEGLSRTAIWNLFNRNKSKDEIDRALSTLALQGLARGEKRNDNGGRPEERWYAVRKKRN